MKHIITYLIFDSLFKAVKCSTLFTTQPNNAENHPLTTSQTRTMRNSDHDEAACTSIQMNEPESKYNKTINLILKYEQTYNYMFRKGKGRIISYKKLCIIIDFSWCNSNQNRLNKITEMLINRNDDGMFNHFNELKKLFGYFLESGRHSLTKARNDSKPRPKNKNTDNVAQGYKLCTQYNTVGKYIRQLKKNCVVKYLLDSETKYGIAFGKFYELIRDVIHVENYFDSENADEVTTMEIQQMFFTFQKFHCDKLCLYNYKYHIKGTDHLENLFNSSFCIFSKTRISEKNITLPEFFFLKDSFILYRNTAIRISYFENIFLVYIISRIEAAVSKMMVLNNEVTISQNIEYEHINRLISYRSFVREVLLTNLLFTLRIWGQHVCKYILLSQFEYVHMYVNVSKYSLSDSMKFTNFFDILFMVLPNFTLKISSTNRYLIRTWNQSITFNRISTNCTVVGMICQHPRIFKRALRKNVLRILNQKGSRFAGLSKLKKTICIHIDKLDERDSCLMVLKAHAIYKFIRLRLLESAR